MRYGFHFIILAGLLFTHSVRAGDWTRVDDHAIRFEGYITSGDLEKLNGILKGQDNTLFVNSKGGDAEIGVQLALKLLPNKLTVIVDGLCASSCANYLFTVGAKKEIRRGWVGYHGNITAMLAKEWNQNASDLKEHNGLTDEQIETLHIRLQKSAKLEQSYFATIGVSQALFDRTQSSDKGMGDGKTYTFLCPKPETFERYGIKNVTGLQDIASETQLGLNNILD